MNESDVLSKMADIELPSPPDWQPLIITIIISSLIILAAFLIIRHFSRLTKPHAAPIPIHILPGTKVLEEIEHQWTSGRITDREASYRLSTLLRLGLELPQLNFTCPADFTNDTVIWENTIGLFNQLRYKKTSPTKLSADDFNHVKKWLSHTAAIDQKPC